VRLAAPGEVSGFSTLLAACRYLGPRGPSRLLRYVTLLGGQPMVLATFAAAARKCRPREEFPGWDAATVRAAAGPVPAPGFCLGEARPARAGPHRELTGGSS